MSDAHQYKALSRLNPASLTSDENGRISGDLVKVKYIVNKHANVPVSCACVRTRFEMQKLLGGIDESHRNAHVHRHLPGCRAMRWLVYDSKKRWLPEHLYDYLSINPLACVNFQWMF